MKLIVENDLDELIQHCKKEYKDNIAEFSRVGHEFLKGDKTSAEFKAVSGGMGVYAQRGGKEFMIRLRLLSGILELDKFKLIQKFANDYSLKQIHLTTRQTIQLHDLAFDDIIQVMEESLEHDLITRGGGGNYPRNVSLSPLSGVEENEVFDVTPYAILVNKYFLSRMNTYKLPRKYKVAFSNSSSDSANATIADLGFLAVNVNGEKYFKVYIGGSLGVNGDISVPFNELVPAKDVLYHVEASLNLLVNEGDFVNKGKARMRFIVKRMGKEEFLLCYKGYLDKVKVEGNLDFELNTRIDKNLIDGIKNISVTEEMCKNEKNINELCINTMNTDELSTNIMNADELNINKQHINDQRIDGQCIMNQKGVIPQKQEGLYTVILHPQGGLLKTEYVNNIITFLETVPNAEVRLSMEESMYIRNLSIDEVNELLDITKEIRNTTRLSQSVSCIGTPTCQIGIQESQQLLDDILNYFSERNFVDDVLPQLHISGCVNSCARHQLAEIGFHGKKKRLNDVAEDAYALFIGGKTSEEDTHLGTEYGDLLANQIPDFLYKLALTLKEKNMDFNQFMINEKEELISIINPYLV
jgi:ferredoxin-nitrite reductase